MKEKRDGETEYREGGKRLCACVYVCVFVCVYV